MHIAILQQINPASASAIASSLARGLAATINPFLEYIVNHNHTALYHGSQKKRVIIQHM